METKLIKIGNSQGFRIPKPILDQVGLRSGARIEVVDGKIVIEPEEASVRDLTLMSEYALRDWDTPEEDKAWAHLQ